MTTLVAHPYADQALATATRLLKPDDVIATTGPAAASLSRGVAGTALLHARLATLDPVFGAAADQHWAAAARICRAGAREGGIYNGAGALATSLILGTAYLPDPDRHATSVQQAVRWLSARAATLATWQQDRHAAGRAGTPWHVFDLINGLSGICRILLAAAEAGNRDAEPGLITARDALITMINTPGDQGRPGWWRPTPENPQALTDPHNHDGANTGLAHGIAGPLLALAACHRSSWDTPAQATALSSAAQWLLSWRTPAGWAPQITAADLDATNSSPSTRGRRDAWCYGTPGIATALIDAGAALNEPDLTATGQDALSTHARHRQTWDVEGPTLCHGLAGILACPTAPETPEPTLAALTAAYNPAHRFGFQHLQDQVATDEPGLLVGAAGIALILADYGSLPAPEVSTTWNAALLLKRPAAREYRPSAGVSAVGSL